MSVDRLALERSWLDLTRKLLPALAAERGWPVSADHCFQRILLDAVYGGVWYAHVKGRPAYKHVEDGRLRTALDLAQALVSGDLCLLRLNQQSLDWRKRRVSRAAAAQSSRN